VREDPDAARRRALRTHRAFATGLLALMAALTLATYAMPPGYPTDLLQAAAKAGFVGGIADWFAVTALFRHPLGLPIPHTAILPARRAKIIESIISIVQEDWLSPTVIRARLARMSPSAFVIDWLRSPEHVERLASPVRTLLRRLARVLLEDEVVGFVNRTLQQHLRELPFTPSAGEWLRRIATREDAGIVFTTFAQWLAHLSARPDITTRLYRWLDQFAHTLQEDGQWLFAFFLQRKKIQRKIVEAVSSYTAVELQSAAQDPQHPLRIAVFSTLYQFADRLAAGEAEALAQMERIRAAILEGVEAVSLVHTLLAQLSDQLEHTLMDRTSALSGLIDRKLRAGILDLLNDTERRETFDHWVRGAANDLVHQHHHEIGLTVREHLEALDTGALVAQIEERVGADLQFLRLNGAVVGGLIGLMLGLIHWLAT
jgi:uncharacterized membrane-anchored protein YjiN (DUF445 family)